MFVNFGEFYLSRPRCILVNYYDFLVVKRILLSNVFETTYGIKIPVPSLTSWTVLLSISYRSPNHPESCFFNYGSGIRA